MSDKSNPGENASDARSIAVVGVGCRFPGADGPDAFWSLLWQGKDAISEVPPGRWNRDRYYDPEPFTSGKMVTLCGGFLERIDQFDPEFYDMDAREAKRIDPQQRLMLDVVWESLEDAGIVPGSLAGSRTGVFVGMRQTDYNRFLYGDLTRIDGQNPDNTYPCIVANRLSYLLDLHGPSVAVDTACSSSLVSVHLACQSLRAGESNLALAGGVNLNLFPEESISRSLAGMISPTGRCRAFDASADGYVIGEGCGAVVLKRLNEARADRDNILAVIQGSAVNHNGLSYRLTAYNGLSQQALLRDALTDADVAPAQVSFVEANGSGSLAGDPIELKALKTVFAPDSLPDRPTCFVSSVKTNIGHLEGAAGIASLIKVVLSLHHGGIPPHLHLTQVNPDARLGDALLSIPTEPQPWPGGTAPRYAAVSAFGLGGANANMIVGEAPEPIRAGENMDRPWHVLTLSARSGEALAALAQRYRDALAVLSPGALADFCFTANVGRTDHPHRMAIAAATKDAMIAGLRGVGHESTYRAVQGTALARRRPRLALLCPAAIPDPVATGATFYHAQPTFRRVIDRCNAVFEPLTGLSLVGILATSREGDTPHHGDPVVRCVSFAVQLGLAELFRHWVSAPTRVLGIGPGEWVAACIAENCDIQEAVTSLVENATGVFSEAVDRAASTGKEGVPEWISVSESGGLEQAMERLAGDDGAFFVEMGMPSFRTRCGDATARDEKNVWLATSNGQNDTWQCLLLVLGTLYVNGVSVDWAKFDADYDRRRIRVPTYPFQRRRLWFDATHPDTEDRALSAVDALLSDLFEGSESARQAPLWGPTPDSARSDAFKLQVRRLRLDQAWDLLGKSIDAADTKNAQIGPDGGRTVLRRQLESLDMQQLRKLALESIETLWHHDDLFEDYLRRHHANHEVNHADLAQTRAALVYMAELIRRKDRLLKP